MDACIVAVAPDFEVVVEREPARWSATQAGEIDRLWTEELSASGGPPLADPTMLTAVHVDRRRLVGRFVRRRDVLAGRRMPQLFDGRPPVPVEACALVSTRGRVVLGRRAEHLASGPGRWELVPASTLDAGFHDPRSGRIDVAAHLLADLVEQTPLPRPRRDAVRPFALVGDAGDACWGLCVAIDLDLSADAVEEMESATTPLYDAFRVVRPVDVLEAGLWDGDELSTRSWALVRLPRSDLRAA
jgi:hypothetical protein